MIDGNEALERVYEIVAVDDDRPYSGSRQSTSDRFEIEVANVQFSYGQEPLLDDVNFKIVRGDRRRIESVQFSPAEALETHAQSKTA